MSAARGTAPRPIRPCGHTWSRSATRCSRRCRESAGGTDVGGTDVGGTDVGGGGEAFAHLEEELGDLLFQIVFHAKLADEEGRFDLADVARGVHDKLVRRHPHVFGDVEVAGAADVVSNWEAIKKDEKGRSSVTEGIPRSLPALMLAAKLARKARSLGVEPGEVDEVRVVELWASLRARAAGSHPGADDPLRAPDADLEAAFGDLLLGAVTMAQRLGVDAEQALRARARTLRVEILAAEGVPDPQLGNR